MAKMTKAQVRKNATTKELKPWFDSKMEKSNLRKSKDLRKEQRR